MSVCNQREDAIHIVKALAAATGDLKWTGFLGTSECTVLHMACEHSNSAEVVKYLLDQCPEAAYRVVKLGTTTVDAALDNCTDAAGNILRLLCDAGLDIPLTMRTQSLSAVEVLLSRDTVPPISRQVNTVGPSTCGT